jgi:TfoX/Sxy family transcriptional regulator of competence genes
MAYDEALAERMQDAVTGKRGVTTKKMFGGICFLLDGKMFAGLVKDELMLRLGPQAEADALTKPGVRPMDFTGRPMKGYVFVAGEALVDDEALVGWLRGAMAFVETVPEKAPKAPKKPRA